MILPDNGYRTMSAESKVIQLAGAEFIRDRHQLGAFVYGLLRDSQLAEDVLQEVWLRLAAEVEKGTHLENQAAWCRGVARNLVLRHWEKQRTSKVIANSEVLAAFLDRVEESFAEDPSAAELWAARQEALDECVAKLPDRSRRLLSLKYTARNSVEEIARTVGRSTEGVTKALFRLRRALLECVEKKTREGLS